MSRHHEIPATPDNMVWGYFDATVAPVLEVDSGDTVTLTSWMAGYQAQLHPDPARLHPLHLRALEEVPPGPGGHFVTGPVFVRGAVPGDVLQIDILEHSFPCDWGYTCILPLLGTIPDDFDAYEIMHPAIDRERGVMVLPWGKEIALDPFFGVIAVAPPAHWGRCPSPPPRPFGGNMDNEELRPGATLYLPVFNEGALFMAGDGHGVQGDGEVCITAGDRAHRQLPPDRAQGPRLPPPVRRERQPPDQHRARRGSRPSARRPRRAGTPRSGRGGRSGRRSSRASRATW
jgi:acetamidase/formamidase